MKVRPLPKHFYHEVPTMANIDISLIAQESTPIDIPPLNNGTRLHSSSRLFYYTTETESFIPNIILLKTGICVPPDQFAVAPSSYQPQVKSDKIVPSTILSSYRTLYVTPLMT